MATQALLLALDYWRLHPGHCSDLFKKGLLLQKKKS